MPQDEDLLKAMGLNPATMDDKTKAEALRNILFTLNQRVGERVMSQLNEQQMQEFDKLMAAEDAPEQHLTEWFKTNVPNYAQLIEEEAQAMKSQHDERMERLKQA